MSAVEECLHGKPRILVIGIGNAYRGDDAVGLSVTRRLQRAVDDEILIQEESGEGTALLEAWAGVDLVILVDAVRSGGEPGTVYRFDAHGQALPGEFFRYSTHAFGVADAVELARALHRLPHRLVVYGIEGKTFAAGVGLSPAVEEAVEHVVTQVQREIAGEKATAGARYA
jgi:hydrogenase maturation protease